MRTKSSTTSPSTPLPITTTTSPPPQLTWKNLDTNVSSIIEQTVTETIHEQLNMQQQQQQQQFNQQQQQQHFLIMRPNTLNVSRERNFFESKKFVREAFNAWRVRARQNYVSADKLQELFQELKVYPTEEQVKEMLHTAKIFARRSNNFDSGTRQFNGITFGEFCVLLADLKRFRTFSITKHDKQINEKNSYNNINNNNLNSNNNNNSNNSNNSNNNINRSSLTSHQQQQQPQITNSNILQIDNNLSNDNKQQIINATSSTTSAEITNEVSTSQPIQSSSSSTEIPSTENTNNTSTPSSADAPEVFLGGSCNPTTWRADVAIPALNDLGISFYNPQVSDWTPDLIELEHRAKEKARVLFFVMDSETRASAGAIEAAHIAGQNARQLVLVLHPYKPQQTILNEPVSSQEFIDLARNQQLLRELVSRRGLPVLDSIPSGLQRTKAILAGNIGRDQPTNIASRLISVRRAFDRVVGASEDTINRIQCQKALCCLGIPNNILSLDSLNQIIDYINEIQIITSSLEKQIQTTQNLNNTITGTITTGTTTANQLNIFQENNRINFDEFCIIAAYLSVLQQEINNSTCISPIKGINVPPPPIFFTNAPEFVHSQTSRCQQQQQQQQLQQLQHQQQQQDDIKLNKLNSQRSLQDKLHNNILVDEHIIFDYKLNHRDSGTSSPQPNEQQQQLQQQQNQQSQLTQQQQKINLYNLDKKFRSGKNLLSSTKRTTTTTTTAIPPTSTVTSNSLSKISVNVEIIDNQNIDDVNDDDVDNDDIINDDDDDDSDSTDSVFSSGSSDELNLLETTILNNSRISMTETTTTPTLITTATKSCLTRDIYLGGSCLLRTRWRQDFAIPYLKKKGITYYLSNLHESINNKTFNYNNRNTQTSTTTTTTTTGAVETGTLSTSSSSTDKKHERDLENDDRDVNDDDDNVGDRNENERETTILLPHSEKRLKYNPIINDDDDDDSNINNHDKIIINEIDDDNLINNKNNFNLLEFPIFGKSLFNPILLDSSRVLFFFITNETRSLAPMTLAAHYIGLGYNVILCVKMLPEFCKIGNETLTPSAIKDYNRGRAYLIDLAKRQGIPVFNDPQEAIECAIEKVKICKSRHSI